MPFESPDLQKVLDNGSNLDVIVAGLVDAVEEVYWV
jgi:hypothetical protein